MSALAVILAGGEGRRMGGAKPLRRFGDTTLIARAVGLARGYAPQVAIAAKDRRQVESADAPVLLDDPRFEGPLAGLAAALAHGRAQGAARVLVLACDMPLLPPDLGARLEEALDASPQALVAAAASGGRVHPACALWTTATLDRLEAYAATGRSSLRGFAEACGCVQVAWPVTGEDPFANVNTADELRGLAERTLADGRPSAPGLAGRRRASR